MNYETRQWVDLHLVDAVEEKWARVGFSESTAIRYRLRNTRIAMVSHYCWNVESLQDVIRDIVSYRASYVDPRQAIPYLHIASHGCPDGLTIGDATPVPWSVLSECLLPLQRRIDFTLPLSLSSCWGYQGFQLSSQAMKEYQKKQPFHTLVGPQSEIFPGDLFNAWGVFYTALLGRFRPLRVAVELANKEINETKAHFAFVEGNR